MGLMVSMAMAEPGAVQKARGALPQQKPSKQPSLGMQAAQDSIRKIFCEITGLPESDVEVEFDARKEPGTFAAIAPTHAKKDRDILKGKKTQQKYSLTLYISERMLNLVKTDGELAWLLAHEYFHEDSQGKLDDYVSEKKREGKLDAVYDHPQLGLRYKKYNGEEKEAALKADIQAFASQGFEVYSDIQAQKLIMKAGYHPDSGIRVLHAIEDYVKKEKSLLAEQWMTRYIPGTKSHPDPDQRIEAMKHAKQQLKHYKEYFPADLEARPQAKKYMTELAEVLASDEYSDAVLKLAKEFVRAEKRRSIGSLIHSHNATKLEEKIPEWEPYQKGLRDPAKQQYDRHTKGFRRIQLLAFIENLKNWPNEYTRLYSESDIEGLYKSYETFKKIIRESTYDVEIVTLLGEAEKAREIWAQKIIETLAKKVAENLTKIPPEHFLDRHYGKINRILEILNSPEFGSEILKRIPDHFSNTPEKDRALFQTNAIQLLKALHDEYGETILKNPNITEEDVLTYIQRITHSNPQNFINLYSDLSKWLEGYKAGYNNRYTPTKNLKEGIAKIFTSLAQQFHLTNDTNISDYFHALIMTHVPLEPLQPAIKKYLEQHPVTPSNLIEIFMWMPGLREHTQPLLEKSIAEFTEKLHSSKSVPSKFHLFQFRLQLHKDKLKDLKGYSQYEAELARISSEKIRSQINADKPEFFNQIIRTIKQLGDSVSNSSPKSALKEEKKKIIEKANAGKDVNATLYALLNLNHFPEVEEFLKSNRKNIALELLKEPLTLSHIPQVQRLLKNLNLSKEEWKQITVEGLKKDPLRFDYPTLHNTFGITVDENEILNLNNTLDIKFKLLNRMGHGDKINKLIEQALTDLSSGKLDLSQYLNFRKDHLSAFEKARYGLMEEKAIESNLKNHKSKHYYDSASFKIKHIFQDDYLVKSLTPKITQLLAKHFIQNVKKEDFSSRIEVINVITGRDQNFKLKNYTDNLVDDLISDTKVNFDEKMSAISSLSNHLTVEQMDKLWNHFSESYLGFAYLNPGESRHVEVYNRELAANLINSIYGNYTDGKVRRLEEIHNKLELSQVGMKLLEDSVISEADKTKTYLLIVDGYINEIRQHVKEPVSTKVDILRWLLGKTDIAPQTLLDAAKNASKNVYNVSYGAKNYHLTDDTIRIDHEKGLALIRQTYSNNPIPVRLLMISDLVTSENGHGLMATEEGRKALADLITDGIEKQNAPIANTLLKIFIESAGTDANPLIEQMVAGMGSKGGNGSDVDKLKAFAEAKGGLWIKLVQQVAADPNIIKDPIARKKLLTINDKAAVPSRKDVISMLKQELGEEFSKVKEIHQVLGSGSVNFTVEVTLSDGKRYVARLVKKNPDTHAQHEKQQIDRMIPLLRAEAAKGGNSSSTYKLLAQVAQDYVPELIRKIENSEVKLHEERKLADKLVAPYTVKFPDLNVHTELVREAKTPIDFTKANPERILFYNKVEDERQSFTKEDWRRAAEAVIRTEWSAPYEFQAFDPDGHRGNWLFTKDKKTGEIIAHRIDINQGEVDIPLKEIAAMRGLLRFIVSPIRLNTNKALDDYLNLLEDPPQRETVKNHFLETLQKIKKDLKNADPMTQLLAIHAEMNEKTNHPKRLTHAAMLVKSVYITQQWIDPEQGVSEQSKTENFVTRILGYPKWMASAANLYKKYWPKKENAPTLEPTSDVDRISLADSLLQNRKGIRLANSEFEELKHYAEKNDQNRQKILEFFKEQLTQKLSTTRDQYRARDVGEIGHEKILQYLKESLPREEFTNVLDKGSEDNSPIRELSFNEIITSHAKTLYPKILKAFLEGQEYQFPMEILNDREVLNSDFVNYFQEALIKMPSKDIPAYRLISLKQNFYPKLKEKRLDVIWHSENLKTMVHTYDMLNPEEQSAYFKRIMPDFSKRLEEKEFTFPYLNYHLSYSKHLTEEAHQLIDFIIQNYPQNENIEGFKTLQTLLEERKKNESATIKKRPLSKKENDTFLVAENGKYFLKGQINAEIGSHNPWLKRFLEDWNYSNDDQWGVKAENFIKCNTFEGWIAEAIKQAHYPNWVLPLTEKNIKLLLKITSTLDDRKRNREYFINILNHLKSDPEQEKKLEPVFELLSLLRRNQHEISVREDAESRRKNRGPYDNGDNQYIRERFDDVNSNYKEKTEKKIESENVNNLYKIYEKEGYISSELINYAKANPLTIDDLEALNETFSRESLKLLAKTLQFADQHTYDVYKQFLNNSNNMENKDRDIILHRLDKNPANCYDNLKKLAQ
jgi:hypothetical protein